MKTSSEHKLFSQTSEFRDKCGVVGVFGSQQASFFSILALHTMQHRGQESTGLLSWNGQKFFHRRAPKTVGETFNVGDPTDAPEGHMALGHVRYSTAGGNSHRNIQPFEIHTAIGDIAVAHNGNLTNAESIKQSLLEKGYTFQSTSDTEIILQLIACGRGHDMITRIKDALKQIHGAYSLVFMMPGRLIGIRDPQGIRPLVLGKLEDGGHILASETCALDLCGAEFVRDIEPGEIVIIDDDGIQTDKLDIPADPHFCVFEYIYFMRPNSRFGGLAVTKAREQIGAFLGKRSHVEADVVIPVPDSGIQAAIGYAEETKLPYRHGIIRSHFIGRTFISPTQASRELKTRLKLSVDRAMVEGKRVVLVDDSIVRGTTIPRIIKMVRDAGAKEVHVRISSPPFSYPCFYGIDTPCRNELTAANATAEEIAKDIGADSLAYLELPDLFEALGRERSGKNCGMCSACFTGEYPVDLCDFKGNEL